MATYESLCQFAPQDKVFSQPSVASVLQAKAACGIRYPEVADRAETADQHGGHGENDVVSQAPQEKAGDNPSPPLYHEAIDAQISQHFQHDGQVYLASVISGDFQYTCAGSF